MFCSIYQWIYQQKKFSGNKSYKLPMEFTDGVGRQTSY